MLRATTEERNHLRPGVERAISNVLPGLLETADARFFNGDYLKDMFDQCTKRALARPDLSPDRKINAREDWDDFMAFFNAAKQWQVPKLAAARLPDDDARHLRRAASGPQSRRNR